MENTHQKQNKGVALVLCGLSTCINRHVNHSSHRAQEKGCENSVVMYSPHTQHHHAFTLMRGNIFWDNFTLVLKNLDPVYKLGKYDLIILYTPVQGL